MSLVFQTSLNEFKYLEMNQMYLVLRLVISLLRNCVGYIYSHPQNILFQITENTVRY